MLRGGIAVAPKRPRQLGAQAAAHARQHARLAAPAGSPRHTTTGCRRRVPAKPGAWPASSACPARGFRRLGGQISPRLVAASPGQARNTSRESSMRTVIPRAAPAGDAKPPDSSRLVPSW
jgi:hypothetical protein